MHPFNNAIIPAIIDNRPPANTSVTISIIAIQVDFEGFTPFLCKIVNYNKFCTNKHRSCKFNKFTTNSNTYLISKKNQNIPRYFLVMYANFIPCRPNFIIIATMAPTNGRIIRLPTHLQSLISNWTSDNQRLEVELPELLLVSSSFDNFV